MFNFNLLTGPLFTAGFLNGFNKRADPKFQPDPWAHYKLMGMGIGVATMKSMDIYFKEHNLYTKSSFKSHVLSGGLLGGWLVTGSSYCMGLLLTKIPSKSAFE